MSSISGTAATSSRSLAATCATTSSPATSPSRPPTARIAEVDRVRSQRSRQEAKSVDEAREIAKVVDRTVLKIPARAGADGRLYGSVTSADLADEVWRTRKIRIDRRKVRLDEPIKALGDYLVEIDLFPEVRASLRVSVAQAEGSSEASTRAATAPSTPSPPRAAAVDAVRSATKATWQRACRLAAPVTGRRREHGPGTLPPQELDAERVRAAARSMLQRRGRVVDVVTEIVRPNDFYRESHAVVYTADPEPVRQELAGRRRSRSATSSPTLGKLDDVGGTPFIYSLVDAIPAVANVRRYAEIVHDLAVIRRLIGGGHGDRAARLRAAGTASRAGRPRRDDRVRRRPGPHAGGPDADQGPPGRGVRADREAGRVAAATSPACRAG